MKSTLLTLLFALSLAPSIAAAKGLPMFINTGDELFEIEDAPTFEDGYTVGYACQRFGLFGADVWTWDCDLMAINMEEFSAGELDQEFKAALETQYSLSDRKRDIWNQYGIAMMALGLIGFTVVSRKKQSE